MSDMPGFNPYNISRRVKRILYLAMDGLLVPISLYGAHALRYGTLTPPLQGGWLYFTLLTVFGLAYVTVLQLQWIKLNAFENRAIAKIGKAAAAIAITAMVLSYLLQAGAPRSVPAMTGLLFFSLALLVRIGGLALLERYWGTKKGAEPVAIYGAGRAGMQLASALAKSHEARPVAFVDDNPALHKLLIGGLPVHSPDKLAGLIETQRVKRVLLAMPSAGRDQQRRILKKLEGLSIPVQVLPSYVEMMAGGGDMVDMLRTVEPDALLGRETVDLDIPAVAKAYAGRVVLVTGAGGSIGSELCRQIMACKPARIILFDHSEYNLYTVHRNLKARAAKAGVPLTQILGSVTDADAIRRLMEKEAPEIVLHAAAYKHVPLVEENVLSGTSNNLIGTQVVAEAAAAAGVERFILISSDKAVRPTNVMGATKRLAELVVQNLQARFPATSFSMVRFGNVLGSSGSVLPLFEKQIAEGGPVTVTHPEVTRFFMTIHEAARLVLLAGAYAKGRDLFVLDMGKPQKIIDIAHRMIALSGRKVKDPVTGAGDIEVQITGLRPGEKLYEELLIDDESLRPTPHPKILRAEEAGLSEIEIARMMQEIRGAISDDDTGRLRATLTRFVEGYSAADTSLPAE